MLGERRRAAGVGQLERPPERLARVRRPAREPQRRAERGERLRVLEARGRAVEQPRRPPPAARGPRSRRSVPSTRSARPSAHGAPQRTRELELLLGDRDRLVAAAEPVERLRLQRPPGADRRVDDVREPRARARPPSRRASSMRPRRPAARAWRAARAARPRRQAGSPASPSRLGGAPRSPKSSSTKRGTVEIAALDVDRRAQRAAVDASQRAVAPSAGRLERRFELAPAPRRARRGGSSVQPRRRADRRHARRATRARARRRATRPRRPAPPRGRRRRARRSAATERKPLCRREQLASGERLERQRGALRRPGRPASAQS